MEEEQVAKATGRLILLSVELSYYFDFSRWIVDAHRGDGKRFVVHADEKLTAFFELEAAIRSARTPRGLRRA